ncbi:hypothetical protein BJ742DRAFT_299470 [Cladochytrium replicatum]|nr:hypothetical protein BJ742DRAFT_299470 [Cladochytrium replicatum]
MHREERLHFLRYSTATALFALTSFLLIFSLRANPHQRQRIRFAGMSEGDNSILRAYCHPFPFPPYFFLSLSSCFRFCISFYVFIGFCLLFRGFRARARRVA